MYKNILVPLDGSPRAERILPHVEGLALSGGSKVTLLQVVEADIPGGAGPFSELTRHRQEIARLTEEGAAYLMSIKERLEQQGIKVVTPNILRAGGRRDHRGGRGGRRRLDRHDQPRAWRVVARFLRQRFRRRPSKNRPPASSHSFSKTVALIR